MIYIFPGNEISTVSILSYKNDTRLQMFYHSFFCILMKPNVAFSLAAQVSIAEHV